MDELEHVADDADAGSPFSAARGRRRITVGSLFALVGVATIVVGTVVAGAAVVDLVTRSLLYIFVPWPLLLVGLLEALSTYGPPTLLRLVIGVVVAFGGYALTLHAVDVMSGPLRRRGAGAGSTADDGDLAAFVRLTGAEPADEATAPTGEGTRP